MPLVIALVILAAQAQTPQPFVLANIETRVIAASARSLRKLATLVPFEKKGWVAYMPDGAANGSPEGLARLFKISDSGLTSVTTPIRPEEIQKAVAPQ